MVLPNVKLSSSHNIVGMPIDSFICDLIKYQNCFGLVSRLEQPLHPYSGDKIGVEVLHDYPVDFFFLLSQSRLDLAFLAAFYSLSLFFSFNFMLRSIHE